jgi:glycosyltransferase involved in cell wall biosynthesis
VTGPRLSVVVPAHVASDDLARCLHALLDSDLSREMWELIVVDDASSSHEVTRSAERADQVVSLSSPPSGPARARNEGAAVSRGDIIAFVDADVVVHPDAIRRLLAAFDDPSVSAAFGSYDDQPQHHGIVSRYRNLLHHRVHQVSAGSVESFWAGLGAVKKSALDEVGGFDSRTYRRPEMEDVELGYRLRDAGHAIMLDPHVLGTHLKRWTLAGMLVSDFTRRGLPWARLLLRRNMLLSPRGLSLGASERASAAFASLTAASFAAAASAWSAPLAIAGLLAFAMFCVVNAGLFRWLAGKGGILFAVVSVPLHLLYTLNAVASLLVGVASAFFSRRTAQERYTPRR